jgi:hypothetical protein
MKRIVGKRNAKYPVTALMLITSSPSRRDAMYGPLRRKSSLLGRMSGKSETARRVRVRTGFIMLPVSRRPA